MQAPFVLGYDDVVMCMLDKLVHSANGMIVSLLCVTVTRLLLCSLCDNCISARYLRNHILDMAGRGNSLKRDYIIFIHDVEYFFVLSDCNDVIVNIGRIRIKL